jgi:hypothetical protein
MISDKRREREVCLFNSTIDQLTPSIGGHSIEKTTNCQMPDIDDFTENYDNLKKIENEFPVWSSRNMSSQRRSSISLTKDSLMNSANRRPLAEKNDDIANQQKSNLIKNIDNTNTQNLTVPNQTIGKFDSDKFKRGSFKKLSSNIQKSWIPEDDEYQYENHTNFSSRILGERKISLSSMRYCRNNCSALFS